MSPPPSLSTPSSSLLLYRFILTALILTAAGSMLMLGNDLVPTDDERTDGFYQSVTECGCRRWIDFESEGNTSTNHVSTCSPSTSLLGPGQSVVSYTFYEGNVTSDVYGRDYFSGVLTNLRGLRDYAAASDWRMRLYYQVADPATKRKLCDLACSEQRLDICDVESLPKYGNASKLTPMLWRFLPLLDNQVSLFFSRDLDSIVTEREMAAVDEFLRNKTAKLHVMRDNPAHDISMLGGTWGAKLTDEDRDQWRKSLLTMLKTKRAYTPRNVAGIDQQLINKYIYPWAKKHVLAHDSYSCSKHPNSVGFPSRRRDAPANFVGAAVGHGDRIEFTGENICPRECRRDPTWMFC